MLNVRDLMTREVVTVSPTTPLKAVAQLLLDRGISGLPVVDDAGCVLGVVSEADFLAKEQGDAGLHQRPLARFIGDSRATLRHRAKRSALTAGEAMTSPAVTVPPSSQVAEAASIMAARGINRLPVVDKGSLVGIVTRADLMRSFVRPDDELERTIREDVLFRILSLQPSLFSVSVSDGIATVTGRVERRSEVAMIEHALGMVPGIVDTRIDVTWAVDDTEDSPTPLDMVFPFGPR